MSTSVNKDDEAAADSEEIVRPVYADDIPQNIRDGFDHTCNYIKQCHDALGKRIDVLITRFDGLADIINMPATNSAPPQTAPAAPLRYAPPARDGHAGVHDRRLAAQPHAGDDGLDDGVDQVGYAPRPRHYEPRPETSVRAECMTELVKLCVCLWMMELGA